MEQITPNKKRRTIGDDLDYLIDKEESSIGVKEKKYNESSTIWDVVWRFLIICLIIDGGIYFYFHAIEKTTVLEGFQRIRNYVHSSSQENNRPIIGQTKKIEIFNSYPISNKQTTSTSSNNNIIIKYQEDKSNKKPKPFKPSNERTKETIYSWKDQKGVLHYSNVEHPDSNYEKITLK